MAAHGFGSSKSAYFAAGKDLYVLVAFHFFINILRIYGDYPLARILHLAK